MTKVKKSTSRKSGTAVSSSVNDQKTLSGSKMITATRNGDTRNFNYLVWGALPPDKDGWKEVEGKPSDPSIKTEPVAPATVPAADPTPPADPNKDDNDDKIMVDHIVSQEDLDLNPELAKKGVKVGETIQIEETED